MRCFSCGEEVSAGARFCPSCGASQSGNTPTPPGGLRSIGGLDTLVFQHGTAALGAGLTFAGRYVVGRKIGEGGMGVVYLARDNHTQEDIALKLIHPSLVAGEEAVRRLIAEGLAARKIRHPNVVAVYDVSQNEGRPFLTMEYVTGVTLREWMRQAFGRGEEIAFATAVGIVRSILDGLAEAHRMGFVHRDLKPENVLLCGDPKAGDFRLKILDFGIAKDLAQPTRTIVGGRGGLGTQFYMAPEQITSTAVGPAADLYSLTVIFYELLMEAVPHPRAEQVSPHRADVPKGLDALIERGLMARVKSRIAAATEYSEALDELGRDAATRRAPKAEPAPRFEHTPKAAPEPEPTPKAEPASINAAGAASRKKSLDPAAAALLAIEEALKLANGPGGYEAVTVKVGPVGRAQRRYFVPGNGKSEWFQDIEGGPEMVVVPHGTFMMGSTENEPERDPDEGPQHRVTIARPFAVGRHAVTRGQFAEFVEATRYDAGAHWCAPGPDRHPVVYINWEDAQAYAEWLAKASGCSYRLLTEAEWEYAARAGTTTPFWWGSSISPLQANYDGNYVYAGGGGKGEWRRQVVAVGDFAPNAWGLYNVHGNVWEWCMDVWHDSYQGAPSDGAAWLSGGDKARRVLRGGSWDNYPRNLRAANRSGDFSSNRYGYVGFRVARTLEL